MSEEYQAVEASGFRICNTISLLLPAYQYQINCAWTKEVSLPAVEEFTCRLLLALQEVLPGEIREYFGLSKRECDVLIETLIRNKLAVHTNDGHLAPASMLIDRTKGNSSVSPSLTKYEEKVERPIFELLTKTIMPSNPYNRTQWGLPQIPVPLENKSWSVQAVADAFGDQYRAFLDFSKLPEAETRKTRLYKVGTCDLAAPVNIQVDLEIGLLPTQAGNVEIIKRVAEKVGGTRQRPLSMDLEAKISDYLNSLKMPKEGMSPQEYCQEFNDIVLARYLDDRGLDINTWLIDHKDRKTGYGTQETRAMIGPLYDNNNRITLGRMLEDLSKDWSEGTTHSALWLSSSVPLWAANGMLLSEFCRKTSEKLSEAPNAKGKITAILSFDDKKEFGQLRSTYHNRIPNGIAFKGSDLQDRFEIFLVPGQLAVVQYHFQPSDDSGATVPIGYITCDPIRVAKIDTFLNSRLNGRGEGFVVWSEDSEKDITNHMDKERLELILTSKQESNIVGKAKVIIKKPPKKW
ncbi:hypothetical protein [Aeromonas hydrophila]|uniref:hypothetical protein n=1 Tax=Aeromonas hydrophila TaxID=644 RepID=UPI001A911EB0|nr:hypothetical protein [Aeromonas hydrophila]MBO0408870.1 hypothetical protein [Aeromonas hydrophila]